MAVETPLCDFGWKAPDFRLPGTDGKLWSLADIQGPNGTLIMFICNHCPYVQAIVDRLVRDVAGLQGQGIGVAAIMSNDTAAYPEDSFDNMALFAASHGFTFPYLFDETQAVARAYDAVCTPDFFGFDGALGLQYRGRLDASKREAGPADARRELFDAMTQVARTGRGPAEQVASMGCSIKWKS
ncbi:Alkyl hydroperoxide reductase/ Thiol specific antioxidant/ Mal allergen [Magnetospirillum sp. LM-5]|uniref:thioredoxin family protein n=1 Tax=Magnetospirillum sp. LM-5 TaxID=2681466 RepID=UPI00137E2D75|nr:thioredoxin family protein [Magnetospirillum sp. LM-5]CAA7625944.1 Alkyl hydroperoxide reductase/ Thiol specific antioxidant/ Mal allergen [Magnetospirillum sp. LM-5]